MKHNMKILHVDIETAPTSCFTWSLWPKFISHSDIIEPGYTLCWAAMWEGERNVMFDSAKNPAGRDEMVRSIWKLLDEADAVVHYNGTKFDIPILFREFVQLGLEPPSHFHQIDLLKTVRKQFKFSSNKLDYVASELGLGNKTHHKGMALWYGCMEGREADWRTMEKYNKQDVKLLRKLYKRILPWISNHPNVAMWIEDPTKPTCTNCGSTNLIKKGTQFNTKSASYDRYKCNTCGTPMRSRLRSKTTSENVLARTP